MSKEMKKMVVPELRFPEFRDTRGWEVLHLGDKEISRFINEKAPLSKLKLESYVSTENILPDYEGIAIASKLPPSGSFTQFKVGDILVSNIRPYLKKVWVADKEGTASNDVFVIRASSLVEKQFLSHVLKNDSFINYVMEGAKGVKMPRGDKASIEKYSVAFPNKPEQQKIATCLTSLDDLISAEGERLKALQAHKKGLMQQLFPAEGETVPRVRFGEFEGEWEEKTLKPFLVEYSERVSANTELPIFSSTRTGLVSQKDYYSGRELLNEGEYGVVPKGYFVYRHMSDDSTFKFNINEQFDKIAVSREYPVFKTVHLDARFLLYKLNESHDFPKFSAEQRKGGTRTRLYFKTLCTWSTLMPSLEEQQKIAACLSTLDDLIAAQGHKLEGLRRWKKGLMQGMFPGAGGDTT